MDCSLSGRLATPSRNGLLEIGEIFEGSMRQLCATVATAENEPKFFRGALDVAQP